MTIYPPRPPSFTCAICREHRDWSPNSQRRWQSADQFDIPPLCLKCERDWGSGLGGCGDRNRDRRIIRQIGALAKMLEIDANRIQNKGRALYAGT